MLDRFLEEHKKHGSPGLPVAYCHEPEFTQNLNVPIHWHKGFEIILLSGGPANFNVNFSEFQAHDGDIIIIPSETLHAVSAITDETSHCDTIIFDLNMLESMMMDDATLQYILPIINHQISFVNQVHTGQEGHQELWDITHKIITLLTTKPTAYPLRLKANLLELISVLYTCDNIITTHNTVDSNIHMDALRTSISYIHEHYNEPISISLLSDLAGFSDDHYIRFFKKHIHLTPNQYLLQLRLDISCKLLKIKDMSITDIAFETGFNNVSYFIRKFKERYELSPNKYRKSLLQ